jgi:hypothetical protein
MGQAIASFKDFLVRRYGLQPCRRFFGNSTRTDYHAAFQEVFGVTLDEVEQCWQEELLLANSAQTKRGQGDREPEKKGVRYGP